MFFTTKFPLRCYRHWDWRTRSLCWRLLVALIAGLVSTLTLADTSMPTILQSRLAAPDVDARSWLLAEHQTGWIIAGKNIDERVEPASLTKLMTSYLVFEALQKQEIKLTDPAYVSAAAWKTGGSKMFLQVDTRVPIEELLKGLIIQSGNDAAVTLAEHLGGTEQGFAVRMNDKAQQMGMHNSHFTNSSGLPDEQHYSTARDLMLLANALYRDFPAFVNIYATKEYTYNDITQQNRNRMLWRDPTADGLKTGYTKAAGYCLIASAKRDGMRLLAIVLGTDSKTKRVDVAQSLLQYGYTAYENVLVFDDNSEVKKLPLFQGTTGQVTIGLDRPLQIVFPRGTKDKLSASLNLPDTIEAPLAQADVVGDIVLKYAGEQVMQRQLVTLSEQPRGPWWSRLIDSVRVWFY